MDMTLSFASATIEYARESTGKNVMSQVLSEQSTSVEAFVALLRAHATVTRRLSAQLTAEHDLTLSDFEVLLRLSRAEDRRMRRVDLADQILLSASGVTRLLDGLERHGYVERAACASDRRVVYAVLTDAGLERLRTAAGSHFGQVDEYLGSRLEPDELTSLIALLDRLGDGASDAAECAPPE
jgi:DNA-binding MarR family transcriptional regulator